MAGRSYSLKLYDPVHQGFDLPRVFDFPLGFPLNFPLDLPLGFGLPFRFRGALASQCNEMFIA